MSRSAIVFLFLALHWSQSAFAQDGKPFQAGIQFAGASSGEFDSADFGVGGRLSWQPVGLIGADAELNFYPNDFAEGRPFSQRRTEGLFGVTLGPRFGRVRPFGKVRPGFVTYGPSPGAFACIQIFPPPLACTLAGGKTVFALDVGGGAELFPTARTVVRVDAGDRLVRYPAPSIDANGTPREDAYFSHDFRFALGAGLRF